MPERNECLASYIVARRWFTTASCSFALQAFYVDATKDEAKKAKSQSLARRGLPYALGPCSKIKRGSQGSQTPVYPPIICDIADASFQLVNVHFHPRNLILQMVSRSSDPKVNGEWWWQVQLLTHTIVQIYDRGQWHDRIAMVHKEKRGFQIGMALDFGEYVMGFLTMDLLFNVSYARRREHLAAPMFDIFFEFIQTLKEITSWARSRLRQPRTGLAVDAIRTANKTFLGVGVYTASELFHLAGLLPIYTEEEVFDNPSRMTRFALAFYVFAAHGQENMESFLSPFFRGNYFLSIRNADRLTFTRWLKVHAQDRVRVSQRWSSQLTELLTWFADGGARHHEEGFFDVFEPSYLKIGLEVHPHLGALAFGEKAWLARGGSVGPDPISEYFEERGLLNSPSFIHPSVLDPSIPLYQPLDQTWVSSFLYFTKSKPVWCAVPGLPAYSSPMSISHDDVIDQPPVVQATAEERKTRLFSVLVTYSREHIVGPLDYCGVARVQNNKIMVCRHDPAFSIHQHVSLEASLDRRKHLQLGKQKTANPEALKRKRRLENARSEEDKENDIEIPKAKRRRLSADKKLMLSVGNT